MKLYFIFGLLGRTIFSFGHVVRSAWFLTAYVIKVFLFHHIYHLVFPLSQQVWVYRPCCGQWAFLNGPFIVVLLHGFVFIEQRTATVLFVLCYWSLLKPWVHFFQWMYLCNIIFKTASHSLIGKNNSTTGEEVIYIVCQIYWRMFLVWRDWRRNTCIFFSSFFAVPLCHQLDVTSSWWFNRKTQHNQTKDAPVILTCQWANISLRVQDWFCVNAASCSVGLVSSFWTIWISGVDCFFLQCLLMFLSFLEVFIGLFALINMSKWKRSSTNCW